MKKLALLIVLGGLFAACDKDDSNCEFEDHKNEIKISAAINAVYTKSSLGPIDSLFTTDFPISLYAYTDDWQAGSNNLINNDQATVSGAAGHAVTFGSGPYYYPADAGTVHVFAAAPNGTEATPAGTGTSPVIDINMSGHDDIMWASGSGYKSGYNPAVAPVIHFAHKLTQLQFTFVAGTNYPTNNLVVSLTVNAQPTVAHMTVESGACTFSGSGNMQALSTANQSSGIAISALGTNANSPVMTQSASGATAFYLTLVVKQGDGSSNVTYANVPVSLTAEAGKSHMITLTFTATAITATATVADWVAGPGANVTV